jgi:hypothetical protein
MLFPKESGYASSEDSEFTIYLQRSFDQKTKDLWFIQELRRAIQDKRKQLGFNPNDTKNLSFICCFRIN